MKMVYCPKCNPQSICCALCNDDRYVPEELLVEWLKLDLDRYDVATNIKLREKYKKISLDIPSFLCYDES